MSLLQSMPTLAVSRCQRTAFVTQRVACRRAERSRHAHCRHALTVSRCMGLSASDIDVAVVGGGPGGLAAAAAIVSALGPKARIKVMYMFA